MPTNTDGILSPSGDETPAEFLSQMLRLAQSVDQRLDEIVSLSGVKVTQGASQTFTAGVTFAVGNWANPGSASDPDGFFSTVSGFEPIVIPTGMAGYYGITIGYGQTISSGTRGYVELKVNSAALNGARRVHTGDDQGGVVYLMRLAVGDRLKAEAYSQQAGSTVAGRCSIEVRKLGI